MNESSVFGGIKDFGCGSAELVDGLAAGSAGLACGVVEIDDDDCADAGSGTVEGDGGSDGVLLGAGGEAVGGVLNVAAGEDVAVLEEDGCSYAEMAVGSVGVLGGGEGSQAEVFDLLSCEAARGVV